MSDDGTTGSTVPMTPTRNRRSYNGGGATPAPADGVVRIPLVLPGRGQVGEITLPESMTPRDFALVAAILDAYRPTLVEGD